MSSNIHDARLSIPFLNTFTKRSKILSWHSIFIHWSSFFLSFDRFLLHVVASSLLLLFLAVCLFTRNIRSSVFLAYTIFFNISLFSLFSVSSLHSTGLSTIFSSILPLGFTNYFNFNFTRRDGIYVAWHGMACKFCSFIGVLIINGGQNKNRDKRKNILSKCIVYINMY